MRSKRTSKVNPLNKERIINLRGFCDITEKAYGAYVYVLSINRDEKLQPNLMSLKLRVPPINKHQTLPV